MNEPRYYAGKPHCGIRAGTDGERLFLSVPDFDDFGDIRTVEHQLTPESAERIGVQLISAAAKARIFRDMKENQKLAILADQNFKKMLGKAAVL